MTTPDDTGPSLSPEREEAVRRLLGSADDAPRLPRDVADRLDATLSDLVAERGDAAAEEPAAATVIPLSRRRRAIVTGVFVAAAVVVAAGIGIPLLHEHADPGPETTAANPQRATPSAGGDTAPHADRSRTSAQMMKGADSLSTRDRKSPRASGPSAYRLDAQRLRGDLLAIRADARKPGYGSGKVHAPAGFTCSRGRFGRGYLVGVRYAGAPAVVAFRAPAGSTQVAEVLQCGTARVLRSVTLPTR